MNVRHLLSQTPVAEITPEDAQAKQKAGAVIVDVREPYEWSEGSIPESDPYSFGNALQTARGTGCITSNDYGVPQWESQSYRRSDITASRLLPGGESHGRDDQLDASAAPGQ